MAERLSAGFKLVLIGRKGGSWAQEVAESCGERGILAADMSAVVNMVERRPEVLFDYMEAPPLMEGLPDWTRQPLRKAHSRLAQIAKESNPESGDVVTVEAYVMARAVVLLADPDLPAGEVAPLLWAAKADVPLWLVSSRRAVPPWLHTHADLVVRPEYVADLVRTILR